jgi:hypothetical protein
MSTGSQVVDVSTFGHGLILTVEHDGNMAWQELYAHPACRRRALHARVPFDSETFLDYEPTGRYHPRKAAQVTRWQADPERRTRSVRAPESARQGIFR